MFFSFRSTTGSYDLRRPNVKSWKDSGHLRRREISEKTEAASEFINVAAWACLSDDSDVEKETRRFQRPVYAGGSEVV